MENQTKLLNVLLDTAKHPRQFEAVTRAVADLARRMTGMEERFTSLEVTVKETTLNIYSEFQLRERAALAVQLQLPKQNLEDLIQFFSEDELRFEELKKYLISKVPKDDSKNFMCNVFPRVLSEQLLAQLAWPKEE